MATNPTTDGQAQAQSTCAATLHDVRRVYTRTDGDVAALDGVSLSIGLGSTTAVTGPSGSGKSTLLFLLAGLARPTAGSITVLDTTLDQLTEEQLADLRREHIGIVFQNYFLIPTLTVCENVMLPLVPAFGYGLEARTKALHCIERVGLEGRIGHLPGELSGGEQQRVGIARALVNEPTIILADEPTGNLDSDTANGVLELLLGLAADQHRTIIMTSHNPDIAARCQRQVRMENGKLVEGAHCSVDT